jgi:hypothetical protein
MLQPIEPKGKSALAIVQYNEKKTNNGTVPKYIDKAEIEFYLPFVYYILTLSPLCLYILTLSPLCLYILTLISALSIYFDSISALSIYFDSYLRFVYIF